MTSGRYVALILLAAILSFINLTIIRRLLKTKNDLKSVTGIINTQYAAHRGGKSPSNFIIIGISGGEINFGIQDTKERAFNYLSTHKIINKKASIIYDQNGSNGQYDITYHVYGVNIEGQQILTIDEAKRPDRIGLLILTAFELAMTGIFYISRKYKVKMNVRLKGKTRAE